MAREFCRICGSEFNNKNRKVRCFKCRGESCSECTVIVNGIRNCRRCIEEKQRIRKRLEEKVYLTKKIPDLEIKKNGVVKMANIIIKSYFHPYRMILRRKQPVSLELNIKNTSNTTKLLSLELNLSEALSFDKSGLKRSITEKIGEVKSGSEKKFDFLIHPRHIIKEGTYPIKIRVYEHYQDYKYITSEHSKLLELKVEE